LIVFALFLTWFLYYVVRAVTMRPPRDQYLMAIVVTKSVDLLNTAVLLLLYVDLARITIRGYAYTLCGFLFLLALVMRTLLQDDVALREDSDLAIGFVTGAALLLVWHQLRKLVPGALTVTAVFAYAFIQPFAYLMLDHPTFDLGITTVAFAFKTCLWFSFVRMFAERALPQHVNTGPTAKT
jgi:hypothetical protein